jgi:NCS1 family nucleobase:cation symporter-1
MSGEAGDGTFGRLPLALGEREYGAWSAHGICFAYAIATWCFLVGSYAATMLPAIDGALCLIAGNLIGVFLTTLPLSLGCQRYGIEQMDFCKTAFGQRGTYVLLVFYLINMLGWSGLLLVMFSKGVINIGAGLGVEAPGWVLNAGVALAMAASIAVTLRGVHRLGTLNNIVTPLLGLVLLYMVYMLFVARGPGAVLAAQPLDPYPDSLLNYATVLELGIANGFSWWGGIGFIARNTRTRRAAVYPQMLQLGLGSGLVSSIAMCCALVVGSEDPTLWMVPLGGVLLGAIALGIMGIANLVAVAISLFASALAMRHLRVLRHRAWWQVLLIASFPCVLYAIWPQELYDRGEAFLAYNGTMYAPISGILFVDYLLLRRRRLCLRSIFDAHPERAYHYWHGFNPLALGGLVLGQVVYFALYNPVSGESHLLFRYLPASIGAFAVPALVYWVGMRWYARHDPEKQFSPQSGAVQHPTL